VVKLSEARRSLVVAIAKIAGSPAAVDVAWLSTTTFVSGVAAGDGEEMLHEHPSPDEEHDRQWTSLLQRPPELQQVGPDSPAAQQGAASATF
jgi:hypothetical protein